MGPTALLGAVCLAFVMLAGWAASAQAAFMVPGAPWRPKDFAFIKKDGVYHLFYIRANTQLPQSETELDFGHATSPDLFYWTQQPVTFEVDRGSWDNEHIWAPHIVEIDSVYWMFYTGVTLGPGFDHTQRMGLAYSYDLQTWTRASATPILSAADIPWAWWNPEDAGAGFRDPFVMPDPAAGGQWLMYYMGYPASDTTGALVGVARSTGSMDAWTDVKPLWITHKSYTFNSLTESPQLVQHNGLWYLFVTTNSGQPLTFYTSPDPLADPAGWTYRGRLSTMLGYDTSFWYASEHLRDGLRDYFAFVSGDRIDIREMLWSQTDWKFQLVQPPLLHCRSLDWQATSVKENEPVELKVAAVNVFGGLQYVEFVEDDPKLGEVVVPASSLGFPNPLPLTGDTTTVTWTARRWPPGLGPEVASRIRIRTVDQTAVSDWLTVGAEILIRRPGLLQATRLPAFLSSEQGFSISLEAPSQVRLDIYDVGGRRLRTLAHRTMGKGVTLVAWDRRDEAGSRVPPGVYFARLAGDVVQATARVVVTDR